MFCATSEMACVPAAKVVVSLLLVSLITNIKLLKQLCSSYYQVNRNLSCCLEKFQIRKN